MNTLLRGLGYRTVTGKTEGAAATASETALSVSSTASSLPETRKVKSEQRRSRDESAEKKQLLQVKFSSIFYCRISVLT